MGLAAVGDRSSIFVFRGCFQALLARFYFIDDCRPLYHLRVIRLCIQKTCSFCLTCGNVYDVSCPWAIIGVGA